MLLWTGIALATCGETDLPALVGESFEAWKAVDLDRFDLR